MKILKFRKFLVVLLPIWQFVLQLDIYFELLTRTNLTKIFNLFMIHYDLLNLTRSI